MAVSLVLTVIGPNRPGLVEALSELVANHQGSWLESRMARLAGQFAGILRVSVPEKRMPELVDALRDMEREGLHVVVERSDVEEPSAQGRHMSFDLLGNDRPGILRDISAALAARGINVDELRTEVMSAPMSGELMFHANADLWIPAGVNVEGLRKDLEALANELMVDVDLDEPV
jgi:glycine cleavage system regulatory protein